MSTSGPVQAVCVRRREVPRPVRPQIRSCARSAGRCEKTSSSATLPHSRAQATADGQVSRGRADCRGGDAAVAEFPVPRGSGPDGRSADYEIASRLSYLLWDTMPDEALFDAAAKGELRTPAGREAAARRLLDDPRAHQAAR